MTEWKPIEEASKHPYSKLIGWRKGLQPWPIIWSEKYNSCRTRGEFWWLWVGKGREWSRDRQPTHFIELPDIDT